MPGAVECRDDRRHTIAASTFSTRHETAMRPRRGTAVLTDVLDTQPPDQRLFECALRRRKTKIAALRRAAAPWSGLATDAAVEKRVRRLGNSRPFPSRKVRGDYTRYYTPEGQPLPDQITDSRPLKSRIVVDGPPLIEWKPGDDQWVATIWRSRTVVRTRRWHATQNNMPRALTGVLNTMTRPPRRVRLRAQTGPPSQTNH